ncbi:unnamed protein product [Fraxinus pennsylvanica]|uniref:Mads box protein n=1 Tax=Fraxinus pennsylvanica TaxID=56036 RepID=A0AAD1ZJA2_9LAMI|nr:unnamed protein product [Fraxinus pennsylvanica]
MGIIIFSPTGKPFSFFHPTMEAVVNRYYHREPSNSSSEIFETYVRNKVKALNETLDEISEKVEYENKRAERIKEIEEKRTVKGWWEAPVKELNKEQVQQLKSILENFINQAKNRMEELRINEAASSSSMHPQGVHPDFFANADFPKTVHPGFFPNANADPNASAGAPMHPQGNFPNTVHPDFFSNASAGASLHPQENFPNTVHPDFFPNASAGASLHPQGNLSNTVHPVFYTNANAYPNASAAVSMHPQENFPNTVHSGFLPNADPNAIADPNLDFPSTVYPGFSPSANADPNASAGASSSGAGHVGASYYNPHFRGRK